MANQSPTIAWQREVGINHTPAYQVSGAPFATGSLVATTGVALKITFPYVTRWVKIINNDTSAVQVGFSENGLAGTNYFTVNGRSGNEQNQTETLELKVTELYLTGSGDVDIVAGLTSIDRNKTSGSVGPSWSGSAGVG